MLSDYKNEINEQINNAMEKIKIGYKYCPQCKEYYKEKAWENEDKKELRKVCVYEDPISWKDNKYENKKCVVSYSTCPMGHIIEENVSH